MTAATTIPLPPIFQTTGTGAPVRVPQPKWANLANRAQPGGYPLGKCFGLLVGEQNSGKSWLLQSNPDILIINTDLSQTVNAKAQSGIWPEIDPSTGCALDVSGQPIVLTWEDVEKKQRQLLDAARLDMPRPQTVGLDTLNTCIRLLKPWVAQKLGKASFNDCHGQQAWGMLLDRILDFAMELRNAGYGVWYVAHLTRSWVAITETSNVEDWSLAMSDGLRERLCRTVEMVLPVLSTTEIRRNTVLQDVRDANGKVISQVPTTTEEIVYLKKVSVSDPRLARVIRVRTTKPMPDVDITNDPEAWAHVAAAYADSSS